MKNNNTKYTRDGFYFDNPQQLGAYVKNKKSHEDALKRNEEDEKTRKPREFKCKSCGKIFHKDLTDNEFSNIKNHPRFCSRACANRRNFSKKSREKISKSIKKNIKPNLKICIVCGKEFIPKPSGKKICSDECLSYYKTHRNEFLSEKTKEKLRVAGLKSAHVQSENRRSKNEIYFCDLCESVFKKVTHNENIFNGWDADVLIYDYKIAVLWNGIWHYAQIKRNSSLKQIQNRDLLKTKEIEKLGWSPYIIEDRGKFNKQFIEKEFDKFVEYVKINYNAG